LEVSEGEENERQKNIFEDKIVKFLRFYKNTFAD